MHTDSAFFTGKTHAVCQDYVRTNDAGPYLILCDGCSDSKDTDTGARLLALAAERTIKVNGGLFNPEVAIGMARSSSDACGLHPNCLDATLLLAKVGPYEIGVPAGVSYIVKEAISVTMIGDGVIAAKRKDGSLRIHWTEFKSGYPYYLNYTIDESRNIEWKKTIGVDDRKSIIRHTVILDDKGEIIKEYHSDFVFKDPRNSIIDWDLGTKKLTPEEQKEADKIEPRELLWSNYGGVFNFVSILDETEWVAIMSDGVLSFSEKATEPGTANRNIPVHEVLKHLLDFRGMKGEFVQRQANWFMRKLIVEKNWSHADDVSVAVIHSNTKT